MILWLALACVSPEDTGKTTSGGDDAGACDAGDGSARDVSVEETDVATVLRVTWTTAEPTVGRVVFENGDGLARATPWDEAPATEHEALLLGMLPSSTIPWHVETQAGDETWCGEPRTATTGTLPTALPTLVVPGVDAALAATSWTIVPILSMDGVWIVILDEEGRYVWAWSSPLEDGRPVFVFRAGLGRDGRSIVYNHQSAGPEDEAVLGRLGFDGASLGETRLLGAHTDFVELDDGRWATLGWDLQEIDGRTILGDTLLVVEEDGTSEAIWDVFDWFTPDLSEPWAPVTLEGDIVAEDWSHVNGIALSEDESDFLITMSFNHGVARVDGVTGAQEWVVAETGTSDFTIDDAERPLIALPHSVQDLGDGHYMVLNRGDPLADPDVCSEATELYLDEAAGTATRAWSWQAEDCVFNAFLGETRRLWNGNTMADWSSSGRIDEVTADGELASRIGLPAGGGFGFADRIPPLR